MPTAYIDRVDTLNLVEKNSAVRSLTRKCRVLFQAEEVQPSFLVLQDALAVCPAANTDLTDVGYPQLILVERSAELVSEEPSCVDVTLKYEHILDGPNQFLIAPPTGRLYGKGRCSITDKTTNFFYPDGDTTIERTQILCAHTYVNFDPEVSAQCILGPRLPWTIIQGGEVNIPFPQTNYKLQGLIFVTGSPQEIAKRFIARINEDVWLGDPEGTWICSEVQWEVLDSGGSDQLYRFEFEFQYNVDTWNPTVVFLDQRTGRPPPDVLKATINDTNGVLRLVPNPLRAIDLAAAADAGSPQEAAANNAVEVLTDIVDAARGAAQISLANADPFNPPPTNANAASAAALDAATATLNGIDAALFAQIGGDPIAMDLPGAVQGSNTGMQAGNGAYGGLINDAVLALNALFPTDDSLPIGGGQAITDIAAQIQWITTCSYAGAVGSVLATRGLAAAAGINQPAGWWKVPALKKANFHELFATLLEQ